jgi:hypothetical protein
MKKVTIEYNIESSFDEEEVRRALNSTDAYLALYDMLAALNGGGEDDIEVFSKLRSEFYDILERRGIDLNRDLS